MSIAGSHSVPSTAGGFVYQFERALYLLATAEAGAEIGIETCDDVAKRVEGEVTLFEQDKLTFSPSTNPITDGSKNFWNTLFIWLTAIRNGHGQRSAIAFLLVTNQVIQGGLARQMNDAKDATSVASCIDAVRAAKASKQREVQLLIANVQSASDLELAQLIRGYSLIDKQSLGSRDEIQRQLRSALQLPTGICEQTVAETLAGWLKDAVMARWEQGQPAWISRQAFIDRKHEIIKRLHRQRMRERPEHDVLVTEKERGDAVLRRFVEHLSMIAADDDLIFDAVNDFIRFNTECSRLLELGHVGKEDWEAFFGELTRRWKTVARQVRSETHATADEELGARILHRTVSPDYRALLAGEATEHAYLTSGGYHRLADTDDVWWLPSFRPTKK